MRILFVTSTPRKGSIGSILTILKNGLQAQGHSVRICYGYYKDDIEDDIYYPICTKTEFRKAAFLTRVFGKEGLYSPNSTRKLIKEIERYKPDVVNLTNVHAYYLNEYDLFSYLKVNHIPTIYTMFDAYAFTGKCPFPLECKKFKRECIDCEQKREYPQSVFYDRSSFLFNKKREAYSDFKELFFVGGIGVIKSAKESALLKERDIYLIDEPQELDSLYYPRETDDLKAKLGIPKNNKVVIAAVPLKAGTQRKGGWYFLDLYERMKNVPGYSFVYIGFNTEKYGSPEGLIKIPYLRNPDEFATYLSMADILFFTSTADTTPCTVIDTLACGTPVVGFDIEGMRCFNISDNNVMNIVPIGDIDAVAKIIMNARRKDAKIIDGCRKSVYNTFNPKAIVEKYIELYNQIVNKNE